MVEDEEEEDEEDEDAVAIEDGVFLEVSTLATFPLEVV